MLNFEPILDEFENQTFKIPNSINEIYIFPATAGDLLCIDFGICNTTEPLWYELFETGLPAEDINDIKIEFKLEDTEPKLQALVYFKNNLHSAINFVYRDEDKKISASVSDSYGNTENDYGIIDPNIYN